MPFYLRGFAASVQSIPLGSASNVELTADAEPFEIVADHAVPIGFLVNELVTNAVKSASPDARGSVTIGFRRGDGEVLLTVQKIGVAVGASVRQEGSTGMGTRFVYAFVRQIGGKLGRPRGRSGTTVTVRLPSSVVEQAS